MKNLELITELMYSRKELAEQLSRLKKNAKTYLNENNIETPCLEHVHFSLRHGAHAAINAYHDRDLMHKIMVTTIEHLEGRIEQIDSVLKKSDEAIQEALKQDG